MDFLQVGFGLMIGFCAGILSALFGVGGAVISTPGIRALGASPIQAVGSTIPAIFPAAVTGSIRYAREHLIDWRIALTCGFAGAAFAVGGSFVAHWVDARWLMVATAALLAWSGISTILQTQKTPVGDPSNGGEASEGVVLDETSAVSVSAVSVSAVSVSTVSLIIVGSVAGFVAGLLGVGGGIIMMPAFTSILKIPIKVAIASSLVAVAVFSIPALASHSLLGHINWSLALALVAGSVPGAMLGSRITVRASDSTMRYLMGGFFCVIAIVYGARELIGIFGWGSS